MTFHCNAKEQWCNEATSNQNSTFLRWCLIRSEWTIWGFNVGQTITKKNSHPHPHMQKQTCTSYRWLCQSFAVPIGGVWVSAAHWQAATRASQCLSSTRWIVTSPLCSMSGTGKSPTTVRRLKPRPQEVTGNCCWSSERWRKHAEALNR